MRLLNLSVIAALVLAAAYVYNVKVEATRQAEHVAKLAAEIQHERDAIAVLRAEWAKLDNPRRIQELVGRHLDLKPVEAAQYDNFDNLPERPPRLVPPNASDPIAAVIDAIDHAEPPTGSTPAAPQVAR